jgi:hypothetical protein
LSAASLTSKPFINLTSVPMNFCQIKVTALVNCDLGFIVSSKLYS